MSTYRVTGFVGAAPIAGEKREYGYQFVENGIQKNVWIPVTVVSKQAGMITAPGAMDSMVGVAVIDTYTIRIDQSQALEKCKIVYPSVTFPAPGDLITGVKEQFLRGSSVLPTTQETPVSPLPSIVQPPKADADSKTKLIIGGVVGGLLLASLMGFGYASGRKAR